MSRPGAVGMKKATERPFEWVSSDKQTHTDSAIQEEPLPTGLYRTRAREASWVLIS